MASLAGAEGLRSTNRRNDVLPPISDTPQAVDPQEVFSNGLKPRLYTNALGDQIRIPELDHVRAALLPLENVSETRTETMGQLPEAYDEFLKKSGGFYEALVQEERMKERLEAARQKQAREVHANVIDIRTRMPVQNFPITDTVYGRRGGDQ